MRSLSFVKMSAAGNDFIVIDNRKGAAGTDPKKLAQRLCERKDGIGADGILLLEKSKKANVRMRIFNPDGSQADMCGNGVRCLSSFAATIGAAGKEHTVETGAGIIRSSVNGKIVKARLTDPKDFRADVDVDVNGRNERVQFLNTGVPHAVVLEPALKNADVDNRGRALRNHRAFAPKGTNVNFVKLGMGNFIEVRTYERGVEAETRACGTGSTASALVAAKLKGLRSPVTVKTSGGETLKVHFKNAAGRFEQVFLEGPVKTIFQGSIAL